MANGCTHPTFESGFVDCLVHDSPANVAQTMPRRSTQVTCFPFSLYDTLHVFALSASSYSTGAWKCELGNDTKYLVSLTIWIYTMLDL